MGLSDSDVAQLEEKLDSGKRPSVVFMPSAGQVAGKVGKVVELASPREGDFVVVAFGRDQLPFAPEEVRLPERGELSRAKKSPPPAPSPPEPQVPQGPGLLPEENVVVRQRPSATKETEVSVEEKPAKKKAVPKQRKAAKDKHPEVSVVLAFNQGKWEVSALRGARRVVAAQEVDLTRALRMVEAADCAPVTEVVDEVMEGVRQAAQAEAEALREQLRAAEERLQQLT